MDKEIETGISPVAIKTELGFGYVDPNDVSAVVPVVLPNKAVGSTIMLKSGAGLLCLDATENLARAFGFIE